MVRKYKKKPVQIEAIQFMGNNVKEIEDFVGQQLLRYTNKDNEDPDYSVGIPTLEGIMKASVGDYIIRGVKNEFYPCKPDIFRSTYDEV